VWWGRKDLFENPQEQAAFKKRYGYALAPPKTLQQLRDSAEFFTRKKGDQLAGKTLAQDFPGFVQEGAQAGTAFQSLRYIYLNQWGGDYWDDQGNPAADSPENQKAMAFYQSLWKYAPAGQAAMSIADVPVVMGNGDAAAGFIWSDFVFSLDKPGASKFAGKYLFAAPPANADDPSARRTATEPSMLIISKASSNKEATYLFLQWIVTKKTQDALFAQGVGEPIRNDTFDLPEVTSGRHKQYYEAVKEALKYGAGFPPVPKLFEIGDEVNRMQQRVGQGQQSPADGLAGVQSKMGEICGGSCILQPGG
jgi:ABC-type glycerol-3-phosphate transport system substrate-binding protein